MSIKHADGRCPSSWGDFLTASRASNDGHARSAPPKFVYPFSIPSLAALLHASVPALTTVPSGTVTDSSTIHEVSVTSQTLAYSKNHMVTIKPEHLLEPLIERSLVGGRSLTLLARHHFGSFGSFFVYSSVFVVMIQSQGRGLTSALHWPLLP